MLLLLLLLVLLLVLLLLLLAAIGRIESVGNRSVRTSSSCVIAVWVCRPIMSCVTTGFSMQPHGFFDRNPAMLLPAPAPRPNNNGSSPATNSNDNGGGGGCCAGDETPHTASSNCAGACCSGRAKL